MRDSVALARYLQRHIQPELPKARFDIGRWQQVLVIPAYRESSGLLDTLKYLPEGNGRTLVILVINRPDSDPDARANQTLRDALQRQLPATTTTPLTELNTHSDLYVYDMGQIMRSKSRPAGGWPGAQGGLRPGTAMDNRGVH